MGLKNLIRVLLPFEYREQVLGDLEERNFRLSDIVSVLPRVWVSHGVRSVTSPPPQRILASEQAIIIRTQQLWDLGRIAASVFVGLAVMARSFAFPVSTGSRVGIVLGAWVVLGAFAYFGHNPSEPPLSLATSLDKRLADYRQQARLLRSSLILGPWLLVIIAKPFTLALASVPAFAAFCVLTVVFIVWTHLWRKQLQQEIERL